MRPSMKSSNHSNCEAFEVETRRADRFLLFLIWAHAIAAGTLIPIGYNTFFLGIGGGLAFGLIATICYLTLRGTFTLRVINAFLLMGFSALFITLQFGRIEMHFHIFGALAFLVIYRDWKVYPWAVGYIALHHGGVNLCQEYGLSIAGLPIRVFNYRAGWEIVAIHICFVLFETSILIYLCIMLRRSFLGQQEMLVEIVDLNSNLEKKVEIRTEELNVALQQSDRLLNNILPAKISNELKLNDHVKPVFVQSATVLFADFVGFTAISQTMNPHEVLFHLEECFTAFDSIVAGIGLEKIKTIGDAYMCAGGIPESNQTHVYDVSLAAIKMLESFQEIKQNKEKEGIPFWDIRIGFHCGPLVAGVIGQHKFSYDIWGDTVNTASRMESSGAPGQINISYGAYNHIRFLFDCKSRGKISVKHKGEVEMFFLTGIKPQYSINGDGQVPNQEFQGIYDKIKSGAKLIAKAKDKPVMQ